MSFGYELISETDRLQEFPESGRIVPEYRNDHVREIIFRPYRIVYRVIHDEKLLRDCTRLAFPREEFQNCRPPSLQILKVSVCPGGVSTISLRNLCGSETTFPIQGKDHITPFQPGALCRTTGPDLTDDYSPRGGQ